MSYVCPVCASPSFDIVLSIDLPPDGDSDDITLHLATCPGCSFDCLSQYEESRRGRLDSESWHQYWFRLPQEQHARLKALIEACPARRRPHCQCPTHALLGTQTGGRWDGLQRNGFQSLGWELPRRPEYVEPSLPPAQPPPAPAVAVPLEPTFPPDLASVPEERQMPEVTQLMAGAMAVSGLIVAVAHTLRLLQQGLAGGEPVAALAAWLVGLAAAAIQRRMWRDRVVLVKHEGLIGAYRAGTLASTFDQFAPTPVRKDAVATLGWAFACGLGGLIAAALTIAGIIHLRLDILWAWAFAVTILCGSWFMELVRTRVQGLALTLPGTLGERARVISRATLQRVGWDLP
jgi:hypothetical protein